MTAHSQTSITTGKRLETEVASENLQRRRPSRWKPAQAQAVLTNLSQVFINQISPEAFSTNMNKTLNS